MPQVSVIIPLYNKGPYIRRALDSVFAQILEDYEIIIIDDGSTDDGPSRVSDYSDPRLRLIRQTNSGPGAARNRGIAQAMSRYVAFLDADDEWLPEFLQNSINNLRSNPECVLSTCNYFTESSSDDSDVTKKAQIAHGEYRLPHDIDVNRFTYVRSIIHSAGTVLCKKEILEKYGGFYEKKSIWGEDQYLWIQVLLNHSIYYDSRKMFCYHLQDSSLAPLYYSARRQLWPAITDPQPIRNNCPDCYKFLLDRHLAKFALRELHCYFEIERLTEIKKCIKLHPLAYKESPFKYILLHIKMAFPYLFSIIRRKYN